MLADGGEPALVRFEIEDQLRDVHTDGDYRKGIFVLLGADRRGSAFTSEWASAIGESLATLTGAPELRMVGLAHMKGVPRLLRGLIRSTFPKRPESWILLDWEGVFEDAYGYEKKNTNILVFLDGVLIHRAFGRDVESVKVEEIRRALEGALTPVG